MVCSYISSCIKVGIQLKPALLTFELTLCFAVVFSSISAGATLLAGIPSIYVRNQDTVQTGFVSQVFAQSSKAPRVQTPTLLFPQLDTATNVGQIFQGNRSSFLNRLDNLLRQHVVTIAAKD